MGSALRITRAHIDEVLKLERKLAPELFRPHTDAELIALEREIKRSAARSDPRLAPRRPHPQLPLSLDP